MGPQNFNTLPFFRGLTMVYARYGYGSIPITIIFSGMNIHLPAILMFTREVLTHCHITIVFMAFIRLYKAAFVPHWAPSAFSVVGFPERAVRLRSDGSWHCVQTSKMVLDENHS
jgi:hypothetical protein